MFTGLYARSHGTTWGPRYESSTGDDDRAGLAPLKPRFLTIAEFLEPLGYRTLAVVANFGFLNRQLGLAQGFQYYDDRSRRRLSLPPEMFIRRAALDIALPKAFSPYAPYTRSAADINREAFALLDGLAPDEPFFLFVNYMDAHDPYLPPPPYDRLFPGKSDEFQSQGELHLMRLKRDVMEYGSLLSPTDREHLISQYDGAIAYLDDQVERLIDRLKSLGVYDKTLIIISSDHGEAFGRRHLVGHGVSTYQGQVRVPLIIKFPGSDVGRVVNNDVSHVDLFPTIVDLLGAQARDHWQGRSLLASPSDPPRIVITESYRNPLHAMWGPRFDRVQRALFQGNLKLVRSSRGKVELYDLKKDPDERNDLSTGQDADAARLEDRLDHWLEHTENLVSRGPLGSPSELDEETQQRLRTLGYIQ